MYSVWCAIHCGEKFEKFEKFEGFEGEKGKRAIKGEKGEIVTPSGKKWEMGINIHSCLEIIIMFNVNKLQHFKYHLFDLIENVDKKLIQKLN